MQYNMAKKGEKIADRDILINSKFRFHQIADTILFELNKGRKKFLIMVIVSSVMILLNLTIYLLGTRTDTFNPGTFFSFSSTLILITSLVFGGSLIVRDFEQPTGNILFPKIRKRRLLTGRLMSSLLLNTAVLGIFYSISAVIIYGLNKNIPIELIYSFIYSWLYSVLILTFIIFLSSILKSTSAVTIVSLLALILIFPILEVLFVVLNLGVDPVFLLTYYARPIMGAFTGTSGSNFFDIVNTETGESLLNLVKSPTLGMVFLGVSIFSILFLILSYILYERRQNH